MIYSNIYFHSIDAKNRLFVPAKFREALGEEFYIFKGPDHCLYVYDKERYEVVAEQFKNTTDRAAQRAFFGNTAEVNPDKQGRVTLTPELLEFAGITKEAVIVGAGGRIEIWNPKDFSSATTPVAEIKDIDSFVF